MNPSNISGTAGLLIACNSIHILIKLPILTEQRIMKYKQVVEMQ